MDRPTRFAAVIVTPFEVSKVRLVLQRVEHPAHFGPFLLLVLQPLEHPAHHHSPGEEGVPPKRKASGGNPPSPRQCGDAGTDIFCIFVYYIICTEYGKQS